MRLQTELCGIKLSNPTVLASGIMGITASSMGLIAENGAGAITMKSINTEGKTGHPNPIAITFDGGMLNAVGLPNKGIKETLEEIKEFKEQCSAPLFASIFAQSVDEFAELTKQLYKAQIDAIEINISCPNCDDEFGKPFSCSPITAAKATAACKEYAAVPLFVKLTPNVPNIQEIAKAVEAAGASAITAINTVPGMMIDIHTRSPILFNKSGGLSGPAIKPIALKCVYDIYEAVKIPIIGTGGIMTGQDAIEMMMAGATVVGIGSAVYWRDIDVFKKVCREMDVVLEKEGFTSVKEVVGLAHK
ncbi:dihydroorotate dehydrogenase [Candidatus Woesearchaeota archaeon]|nr:MAG: dihydroorotate dehydrogenase fumarate [archaeon GW2011_AR4]MBS3129084.1 dihydroorotate dehydrogenase [Candidatus Woesearchaeota archaeon]HIH37818.1 dihydroorotate dehydrogenase [Candidatus Woesearchaeota archaeon]HIH48408.1 dihydroorotate dehydrogenase [Candidatus Woesearchaeota archaeon]HIJ03943.1 dihydroorotate dehydrogenase [Candidatus Woesearchaeota archaeon]